ncbi:MAG: NAD(P)H-binding protein [Beijerinckiaceae bacterium]
MAGKTHTILIAGGSGLVGHAAIRFAVAAGHFVIALVRRGGSLSIEGLASEETLKVFEVDFDALDQYQLEIFALAPNALICALGTTIRKAGSKDGFARVDRDYVAAFAALGRAAGASHFGLVSAAGADPRSSNFYLRTKGEAEAAIRACGYLRVDNARPSFLLGQRAEVRTGERAGIVAAKMVAPLLIGPLVIYRPIPAANVARALVNLSLRDEPGVFIQHYTGLVAASLAEGRREVALSKT